MPTRLNITALKPFPVKVGIRNQMLLKVETDQGVFGWGESGLTGREKAVTGAIEHFAQFLVGQDAMQIGRIWQELYRSQYFEGGRVLQAAISAIDIALHEIKGKALGVPVYELLGGKQRWVISTFASTGDSAANRRSGTTSAGTPGSRSRHMPNSPSAAPWENTRRSTLIPAWSADSSRCGPSSRVFPA